jgi:hypothetical protein
MLYNKNETTLAGATGKEAIDSQKLLNQLNLLPMQIENEQGIGSVDGSDVVGNNLHGNENTSVAGNGNEIQTNHVQENYGVTGITGTGHTINIYQCPKELIELLERFSVGHTEKL